MGPSCAASTWIQPPCHRAPAGNPLSPAIPFTFRPYRFCPCLAASPTNICFCAPAGNPLSPAIPFTFGPYRFWQLARSLWALGSRIPAVAGAPAWVAPFTLFLLAFWIFDHGVTALQLPW